MGKEFMTHLGDDLTKTRLGYYINQMNKIEREFLDTELMRIDITFSQFLILNWLWRKGDLTQKEIHQLVKIKPSSLSSTIKILIKKGLVVQKFDKQDARIRLIALTDKAKKIEREAWEIIDAFDRKMKSILGESAYKETLNNLEKLINNF